MLGRTVCLAKPHSSVISAESVASEWGDGGLVLLATCSFFQHSYWQGIWNFFDLGLATLSYAYELEVRVRSCDSLNLF